MKNRMNNFWIDLPRPFTVLAPLDGVTDVVFRQIITKVGKPDVLFTEFTNTDGLVSRGRGRVLERFRYTKEQQPIVAQIWGTKPDHFYKSAEMVASLGFAGIDINMGCPERTVIKNGACSALIKNHALAKEIIEATTKGAGELPVSVKTRIGFAEEQIDEWISFVLEQKPAALTVHLRTVKEMSHVDAHWELMPKIVALRDTLAPDTILIGNGDIKSLSEIQNKYKEFGCDGFMVGRGIFHNPWIFNKTVELRNVTVRQRLELYKEHIDLFEKTWKTRHFGLLKKFCKTYINNFDGASELREEIMKSGTLPELKRILGAAFDAS
jgi:tRNA-dihydrouridine synthase